VTSAAVHGDRVEDRHLSLYSTELRNFFFRSPKFKVRPRRTVWSNF
jgi:hypothetical protein